MATRKEIAADLLHVYGITLNMKQIGQCLGMNKDAVRVYMDGMPFITRGRDKRYFSVDLAKKIELDQRLG